MPRITAIAIEKGGVLKTSTSLHLADYIVKQKKESVLVFDLDTQGGINAHYERRREREKELGNEYSMPNVLCDTFEFLNGNYEPTDEKMEGLTITRGTAQMSDLDSFKIGPLLAAFRALKYLNVDHIIIDLPPTTSYRVVAALSVSDGVFIPNDLSHFSLKGLGDMMKKIMNIRANAQFGSSVMPLGLVPTLIDNRDAAQKKALADIMKKYGDKMVLPAQISLRPSCKTTMNDGLLMWELKPGVGTAAMQEWVSVCEKMYQRIKGVNANV